MTRRAALRISHRSAAIGCLFALTAGARADLQQGIVLVAPPDVYADGAAKPQELPAGSSVDNLVGEMQRAIERGEVSDAFRLAAQICRVDPEHEVARRVLGYVRVGGYWCGGYAALQLKRGLRWNSQFGWIRDQDLPRWQAGKRPWGKRWIDAKEDALRHAAVAKGWRLRTDHFQVTTNHSRGAAVELAVRLERLYQLWRQLFGEFAASSKELQARLNGKQPTGYRPKPFRVIYHRTRQEYQNALRPRQPQIDITLGIYFDHDREAHFFAGDEQDPGTVSHEAVHQLFFESKGKTRHLAALANAWAVEGVACYFESLRSVGGGFYLIGGADAGRLPAARHRRLVDDYYVSLSALSELGTEDLQRRKDLPRLYSQSAGLATFLMQYDGGKYRSAFRELLAAVYAGRDDASTLQSVCGEPLGQLDREYRRFLEELDSPPAP